MIALLAAAAGMSAGAGIGLLLAELAEHIGSSRGDSGDLMLRKAIRLAQRRSIFIALMAAAGLLVVLGLSRVGLLAAALPMILRGIAQKRLRRRDEQTTEAAPHVARAISDALSAGMGMTPAIVEAARSIAIRGPARKEMSRVSQRLLAGEPLDVALASWASRTQNHELHTIIAALLLHGEAGGRLSIVLSGQADGLERSQRANSEARSATVQVEMAAKIVGGMPLLAMASALAFLPDLATQVTSTPLGAMLVALSVGMQATAFVLVKRLTAPPA